MSANIKKPLVSIITPSFDQGRFIEETILSVLDQDYPDIEYIVVDGGSTDETVEVLKKYGERLKWISEEDAGQADAIRKGFKMATGEIVGWLCSDDLLLPGTVKSAVEFFLEHEKIDMLYGKTHYIDEAGKDVGSYPTEPFNLQKLASLNFISQPSVFMRRLAYDGSGGIDTGLSYAMDYDLWLNIAASGYKIEYYPEYLSSYRLHGASKTVSEEHALGNSKEAMEVAYKYFKMAPANRVYVYAHELVKSKAPAFLRALPLLLTPIVVLYSTILFLKLNRGVKPRDLGAIKKENIKKAIKR